MQVIFRLEDDDTILCWWSRKAKWLVLFSYRPSAVGVGLSVKKTPAQLSMSHYRDDNSWQE